MDLEQLKVIMETIGVATGAAKTFGVFWLVIQFFKIILIYSLGAGIALGAYKIISRVVKAFIENDEEMFFVKSLRKMVFPNGYGHVSELEREKILEIFKRGVGLPE